MTNEVEPKRRMSLRTRLKPPKPFTGEVFDDVSSSIMGDRTLDSSEIEESCTQPAAAPAPMIPELSQSSLAEKDSHKLLVTKETSPFRKPKTSARSSVTSRSSQTPTAEVRPVKPSLSKKASASEKPPATTQAQDKGKMPRSKAVRRCVSTNNRWRPGRGMTPAGNTRYLGPKTEYNPNLPPAAFPTTDTEELCRAWERGEAPYGSSNSSVQGMLVGNAGKPDISSPSESHSQASRQEDTEAASLPHNKQVDHAAPLGRESLLGNVWETASDLDRTPSEIWDDLSVHWRLRIIDSIAAEWKPTPTAAQIFHKLQLMAFQIDDIQDVLIARIHCDEEEERAHKKLRQETTDLLLRRKRVSEDKFREVLNDTLYKTIYDEEENAPNPNDRQDALMLLSKIGMKSKLLRDSVPPFTPAEKEMK